MRAVRKQLRLLAVILCTLLVTAGTPVCGSTFFGSQIAAQTRCCKFCKQGKACGDSCIAKNKKCSKAKGCACNG